MIVIIGAAAGLGLLFLIALLVIILGKKKSPKEEKPSTNQVKTEPKKAPVDKDSEGKA